MPEITSHSHGAPCWADLSTTDPAAAVTFYSTLFGWEDDPQPMPIGPDALFHMQKINGLEAAAITPQMEHEREQGIPPHWNTYITVNDVDSVAGQAADLGGAVLDGPFDVFQAGRLASIQDPQGAVFKAWKPNQKIGARVKFEPGALTWHELLTTDSEAAVDFYSLLLGLERAEITEEMDYIILKAQGTEVAGVMQITPDMGSFPPHWGVYYEVVDVDRTVAQVQSLGGSVLVPATDIPGGIGRFAALMDPQGAAFNIFKGVLTCGVTLAQAPQPRRFVLREIEG